LKRILRFLREEDPTWVKIYILVGLALLATIVAWVIRLPS